MWRDNYTALLGFSLQVQSINSVILHSHSTELFELLMTSPHGE